FGWFFRLFKRGFKRASSVYSSGVARVLRVSVAALVVYVGLVALGWLGLNKVPQGFVPQQDKSYLVAFAQLPDAATLDRTEAVIRRMSDIALKHPGVESSVAFPGLSVNGFVNASNTGIVFVTLKPQEERESAEKIAAALNAKYSGIQEAYVAIFPPPPVQGLGSIGGFKLFVDDRGGAGFEEWYPNVQSAIANVLRKKLPDGMSFEWTELAYQELLSGNTMVLIFPLCVLLVYVVLAAQYESWWLPLAVILVVPLTILSAIAGVWVTGGDN